ncbi:MAG: cyanophycinase, partial [Dongiaceae bacterium]
AVAPITQPAGRGALVLEGGGRSADEANRRIVALAGTDPHLCLIDVTPAKPDGAAAGPSQLYRKFNDYSGVRMHVLALGDADVENPGVVAVLRSCNGYFFNGGDPQRFSDLFLEGGGDTAALAAIRERFERGGAVVSGSSAGAMLAGSVTLCECGAQSSVAALTEGKLFQAPGFGLVEGVLVDAHFFARGLLGRHLFALARNRIPFGVGIDERTAVVVPGDDGWWEVIGEGHVAVIELPRAATVESLGDFRFSLLSAGDRFDPVRRAFRIAASRPLLERADAPGATPATIDGLFMATRIETLLARLVDGQAAEAVGSAAGGAIRIRFRRADDTLVFGRGDDHSIIRLRLGIERS